MVSKVSEFASIIPKARLLYYSGKHNEALALIQQSITEIENASQSLEESATSQLIEISKELELTSLYFAVQSIFLHNIDANQTISLLNQKLSSNPLSQDNPFSYDLQDLLGLAHYYQEMSKVDKNFEEAEKFLSSTLQYRENVGSSKLPYSYFHLGLVQQYSGKVDQALHSFRQANQISQDDPYLMSFITRHLGFLVQQAGDLSHAKTLFEHSLQLRLDNSVMVYVPFSCITLADIYIELNERQRAEQLLLKAIEIGELISLDRALALGHLSLGRYYRAQEQDQETLASFLSSYYFARKIGHFGIMNFINNQLVMKSVEQ